MPKRRLAPQAALAPLLAWLLAATPVLAETPPGPAGTDPQPAVAAPVVAPAPPSDWIAPEDIVDRADALSLHLDARRPSPSALATFGAIEEGIGRADTELETGFEQVRIALAGRASLTAIQDARRELEWNSRAFPSWMEKLQAEARRVAEALGEVSLARDRWARTLERPETAAAGEAVLARVESSLASIDRASAELQAWRVQVLALNDRLLDRSNAVKDAVDKLEAATLAEGANVVVPDDPPLWNRDLAGDFLRELPELAPRLAAYRHSTRDYLLLDVRPFVLQAMTILLLMVALQGLPERSRQRLARSQVSTGTARLLARPYAIALLLGLMASPTFHPTAPQRVMHVLALVTLFPVARVLMLANERTNLPLYAGLCALLVLDRAALALASLPASTTLLFLVELGVALLLAHGYRRRLVEGGGNPWLARLLTAAMVGIGLAVLAEIGGWTSMAALVGRGILVSGTGALYVYAATISLEALFAYALASPALRSSRFIDRNQAMVQRWTSIGLRLAGGAYWLRLLFTSLGLRSVALEALQGVLAAGVSVGALSISIGGVLAFVLTLVVARFFSHFIHEVLEDEVFPRTSLPRGIPHALLALTRYAIYSIGFVLALAAAGVEVGQLSFLLGGLGVGIGLGLQDVVKNFAAGVTILLERRVHVGDAVQIPDKNVFGRVLSIGMRASVVRNWNGAEVVMPNDDLVSGTVTNWTLSDRAHRVEVTVGVAYGNDPAAVIELLLGVVRADRRLLATPPPTVLFSGFGPSSLDFIVRAWSDEDYETASAQRSDLGVAIHAALRDAGIKIPFPQVEVTLATETPGAGEPATSATTDPR